MARAEFHKNQRVFVDPVGTWAIVEHVIPQWVKGLTEPFRVTYDVGLGREFEAHELQTEDQARPAFDLPDETNWQVVRGPNTWKDAAERPDHPYPGTIPFVSTDAGAARGWRVPGAEYDLDPGRIEMQARIMAASLRLLGFTQRLLSYAAQAEENLPTPLRHLAREAEATLREILQDVRAAETSDQQAEEEQETA